MKMHGTLIKQGKVMLPEEKYKTRKKKIDKSIDFLRGWEKKMVSIFCLRCCVKVEVS